MVMNILKELLDIITSRDHLLLILSNRKLIYFIYLFIFVILFLENAILPLFFYPEIVY